MENEENPPITALATPIGKLADALSKAQGEIKAPKKDRKAVIKYQDKQGNWREKVYSYADLADVIDCIREPLAKNSLAVIHQLEYFFDQYGMTTSLIHSSGERIATWYPLPSPNGIKPTDFGSAITYARRYSLSSLVGIASEEDDDGEAAEASSKSPQPTPITPKVPQSPQAAPVSPSSQGIGAKTGGLSGAQIARLFAIASQRKWSQDEVKNFMFVKWGIGSTKELTREQYELLVGTIQAVTYQQAMAEFESELPSERK